jgi:hypothetical protein
MPHSAWRFITAGLLLFSTHRAEAQQDSTAGRAAPGDTTDVLVLDHDFTSPGEFARVFLQKGLVYRAVLSTGDASLEILPLKGGPPVFFAREESESPGASGFTVLSVYPRADATYQIRLVEGGPVVNLKLYRDVRASRRRQKVINEPGWEIGAEVAAGFHSGYLLNITEPDSDSQKSGFHFEGCFSARQGPGILRVLSGCALGAAWDSRPGSKGTLWFFLEPRVRFLGGKPRGQSNTEIGGLLRAGFGAVNRLNRNPTVIAPGIYIAQNTRKNVQGKGPGFIFAWHHYLVGNRGTGTRKVGAELFTLGIGFYQ